MISVDDVKTHLRIDHDDDDSYLLTLINVAYEFAENYTNRIIVQKTESYKLDSFPVTIELPYNPVSSITTIAYVDVDDADQVFTDYYADLREIPATITPTTDSSFPSTNEDPENVVITYVVGYTTIPSSIDHAVMLIIGSLYEQRENHITGVSIHSVPVSMEYLLTPYRLYTI